MWSLLVARRNAASNAQPHAEGQMRLPVCQINQNSHHLTASTTDRWPANTSAAMRLTPNAIARRWIG